MSSRAEHYKRSEKILAAVEAGLNKMTDADANAMAICAQAHAMLANVPWEMEDRD